jgi:hypothetical protein
MDMKKILQALDGVSAPSQQSAKEKTDMAKFISIVEKNNVQILNEGSNPHKVALPVQMAMQHYQKEDAKKETLLRKYFKEAEENILQQQSNRKELLSQYAQQVSKKVLARSKTFEDANNLAQSYISQLTAMMQQATQPWEKKQLEYRIKAVQQGMVPQNKKILPPVEWERSTDPTTIARIIGKDGLSPEYLEKSNMFGRGLDYIGLPGQHPTNPGLKFESGK